MFPSISGFSPSQASGAEIWELLKPLTTLAAKDNIQCPAILACVEAGSQFSICTTTLELVQTHVASSPPVVDAIGGTAGLSSPDSTTLLAQTRGGLHFLAVTLPLLATVGPVAAAQILDGLFERLSFKNFDKPPVQAIQDILHVLEARCQIQRFTNFIDKYRALMTKIVSSREASALGSSETPKENGELLSVPTPGAIIALFENFRNGCAQAPGVPAKRISIETPPATPWIPAFAEWFCGSTVPVYLKEHSETASLRTDSQIHVIITEGDIESDIGQAVINNTKFSQKLVDGHPLPILVGLEKYGSWLLYELDFLRPKNSEYNHRMRCILTEALSYALPQILSLKCGHHAQLSRNSDLAGSDPSSDDGAFSPSPLPTWSTITKICNRILQVAEPIHFLRRPQHSSHLPHVERHMNSLAEACLCDTCSPSLGPGHQQADCLRTEFYSRLAYLITDILAASLFEEPDSVQVITSRNRPSHLGISRVICEALQKDQHETMQTDNHVDAMDLWFWAQSLVGHYDGNMKILTSKRGQVMYPAFLDSLKIPKHGYLMLRVQRGTFRHEGHLADLVCPAGSKPQQINNEPQMHDPLRTPWHLTYEEQGYTAYNIMEYQGTMWRWDPAAVISSLPNVLVVEECHTSCEAKIHEGDGFTQLCNAPWEINTRSDSCYVDMASSGACDSTRIFILSFIKDSPVVLRGDACWKCSLKTCRSNNVNVLVL